jgi:hypothetical protein
MPEVTQQSEPTRDEILQSHLVAIREEIRAVPGRIFAWFFGAACVAALLWWLVMMAAL